MTKSYVIDRIEAGVAICECPDTGERLSISAQDLPKNAKEGDIVRQEGLSYTIDAAQTQERLESMAKRLNKLFGKSV